MVERWCAVLQVPQQPAFVQQDHLGVFVVRTAPQRRRWGHRGRFERRSTRRLPFFWLFFWKFLHFTVTKKAANAEIPSAQGSNGHVTVSNIGWAGASGQGGRLRRNRMKDQGVRSAEHE